MNRKHEFTVRIFLAFFIASFLLLTAISAQQRAGDLDATFGIGGIVGDEAYAFEALAIQPDGKIVVASFVGEYPDFDIAVFRYNPDGSLDTTFDGDGRVTTDIGGGRDAAHAVALQSDGKILVGANSVRSSGSSRFVVVRYNSDGSLDPSFDSDGKVITFIGGEDAAHSVTMQPDGKILVAGRGEGPDAFQEFVLIRYNSNGSLDSSFGDDGIVTTDFNGSWDVANSVALQTDGKIIISGTGSELFTIVRYNSDGSLDTSFDGDGKVTADSGVARSVAVQPDGKIIAAGNSSNAIVLRRYNSNGLLDTTFADDGSATFSFQGAATATSVVLRPDGKIVVAGSAGWSQGSYDYGLVVAKYNPNGSRDTTFGDDGVVTMGSNVPEESYYSGNGVAVDAQGRIVIAGRMIGYNAAVYRFLAAGGKSEFDYDGDGRTDASVFRPSTNEWHIMQSSGGIRVQGWGLAGDKMAPADFDGDGKTDLAVFRLGEGNWYILNSLNNTVRVDGWGLLGDLPVPADYNGDGKADLVVYRPSNRNWYRRDSDGLIHVFEWGLADDRPAPADFTGDGRTDMAVFRPGNGTWYVLSSSDFSVTTTNWGVNGDVPVAADYSGDGKADFVVFRPSDLTWYRRNSDDGSLHFITWGIAGDIPAPGDFDGDVKTDLAVYRPSNGTWYIFGSTSGIYSQPFGVTGDIPTPNSFVY